MSPCSQHVELVGVFVGTMQVVHTIQRFCNRMVVVKDKGVLL
jgi:hypothetical protein